MPPGLLQFAVDPVVLCSPVHDAESPVSTECRSTPGHRIKASWDSFSFRSSAGSSFHEYTTVTATEDFLPRDARSAKRVHHHHHIRLIT